jgi:hypothetical protein
VGVRLGHEELTVTILTVSTDIELPEEVAASPCTAVYTFAVTYHHATPIEDYRREIAARLEEAAAEVRAGQHDPPPPPEEEHQP